MDLSTQLTLLKTVTVRTGGIHEAQQLQLKMWPRMIRGTTRKTKVELDTERKLVRFVLDTDKTFRLDVKTKRLLKEIQNWTRSILWDETDVVFVAKGKTIHDSRSK